MSIVPLKKVSLCGLVADKSTILEELELQTGQYLLASFHREENVDSENNLQAIIMALDKLAKAYDCPVVVSTHPRTRKRIDEFGIEMPTNLKFLKPFGFLDYNKLQINARCVISDSGTISEESAMLGFPATDAEPNASSHGYC